MIAKNVGEGRVFVASDADETPPVERPMFNYEQTVLNPDFLKKLGELRKTVEDRYRAAGLGGEKLRSFLEHNRVILSYTQKLLEISEVSGVDISAEDAEDLMVASATHDIAKADTPLVKHGWEGAKSMRELLLERGHDPQRIEKIAQAIERHMGPIPGFMSLMRERWNAEKPDDQIPDFPRPQTTIDQMLYDIDMLSLIDRQGIGKLLTIRETEGNFRSEDEKIALRRGITSKQVAWESALRSARQASVSLYTDAARGLAQESLKKAEEEFVRFFRVSPEL